MQQVSEKEKEFKISGSLTLHGKEKKVETPVFISKVGDQLLLKGRFIVTPQDFDISIPKIVRNKIAKNIEVFIDFKLKAK